nr:MAG TPA: hypothetical protein [Caudoviricetes sp.]
MSSRLPCLGGRLFLRVFVHITYLYNCICNLLLQIQNICSIMDVAESNEEKA